MSFKHGLGTLKLTEQDQKSVAEVMALNWLSPGPKVKTFEAAFSSTHNQKHGVMVNSGTDALRIALAALKEQGHWKDGDGVFVPAITFPATVNVVLQLNLKPLLVDVSMYDFNLNLENLKRLYYETSPTGTCATARAIVPVHLAGTPCDMLEIMDFAKTNNLKVLEDSCESMGVEGIAKADVTAFSFYVAHILTTGVGGMATTNDPELAKLMWSYANHGRREPGKFQFDRVGYSARPTEFEAAIGLNQLPTLGETIEKRRRISYLLYSRLCRYEELYVNYWRESACMFFPVMLLSNRYRRQDLMDHLTLRNIETRTLMPILDQPCYKGLWDTDNGFTVAKEVNERGFYLPSHQHMTEADVDEIAESFQEFFDVRLPALGQTAVEAQK